MRFALFIGISTPRLLLGLLIVNLESGVLLCFARFLHYLLRRFRVKRGTPLFLLLALLTAFLVPLDYLSLARQVLNGLVHLEFGISIVLLKDLLLLLRCAVELLLLLNARQFHLLLGWLDVRLLVPAAALLLLGRWI
jgi:hypothetical protein